MKVIKEPQKPKVNWTKEIICPMCGATLEYNNLDVEKRKVSPGEIGNVLTCGYCKHWFEI